MNDELCNLIDIRLREKHEQKKADHDAIKKPFKLYPSELGLCLRAVKFRQLGMEAAPFSLDTLNRFDKGSEVEVYVKKFLKPEEILFEELAFENEHFSGRADIAVRIGGQNILYELKSKDKLYIKYLKSTEQTYESLKQNLFQAFFYYQELRNKWQLDKAVVLAISEDRSWKLPFTCPESGSFIDEFKQAGTNLITTMLEPQIPSAKWTWQCYNKKYCKPNCQFISHCCGDLEITIEGGKICQQT